MGMITRLTAAEELDNKSTGQRLGNAELTVHKCMEVP